MSIELMLTALLLGLASSGHCIFMCGGISCALSQNQDHGSSFISNTLRLMLFHFGRICCYASLGLVFGLFIHLLNPESTFFNNGLRGLAAALIIAMGLYIAGLNNALKKVENKLSFIWQRLQPVTSRLMQSNNTATRFLLGFTWGFLPCGMIYSTVLWASTAANSSGSINNAALNTALLMLIFGLGTMPSLLLLNISSLKIGQKLSQFFRIQHSKRAIGLLLVIFGLWSFLCVFFPMPSFLHNMPENSSGSHSEHHHH